MASILFNGTSSETSIPHNNFAGLSTGTVELFIKRSSMSAFEKLVFKNGDLDMGLNNSGEPFGEVSGVGNAGVYGSPVDDDAWHHLAITWDGTNIRGFVDGALGSTVAATGTQWNNSNPLVLGKHAGNGGEWYGGLIGGFFRISDTARYTAAFTAPTAVPADDANTLVLIDFSEGSGTTAADTTSNNNDMTLTNITWSTDSPFSAPTPPRRIFIV